MTGKQKVYWAVFLAVSASALGGCAGSLKQAAAAYEKTSRRYENLLKRHPSDSALRLELAQFYYDIHDYAAAAEVLKNSLEQKAQVLMAKSLARLKDYTRAVEVFTQVGQADDQEYLFLYGQTLEAKNLFSQAVVMYQKLKGQYAVQGQERIKAIGIQIEEGLPDEIGKLLKEHQQFLSAIPDEESATLLVDETIEVNPDNTSVSTLHVVAQVLKEKGKDLAEVQVGYDSTYERIELEYARTITPDNKIVYAGKEGIRDVSKYLNFPLYSNARAFIISMPSVEVGAIIEYKVKIYSSKLVNDDDFSLVYSFRERNPIGRAMFKVTVPKGRKVNLKYLNKEYAGQTNLEPAKEGIQGKDVYKWEFKEIAPIIPEDKMPPVSEINPAIIISSLESWQEVYKWWQELFKGKTELSPEAKEFTKQLIKDAPDDLSKAKKIYEFCVRDVRYVAVEYGESGYEPHKATDVFWNRYGDCKDKATLLVAMLREAGFKAYPVLIPTRDAYPISEDFAALNFNHAIAVLDYQGKTIFMDGTAVTTSFGDLPPDDQGRKVLVVFDDEYKVLTTPLLDQNSMVYEMDVTIDEQENARIKRTVTGTGFFASSQRYYFQYTHPQLIKENIEQKMTDINPFSKLVDYNVANAQDLEKQPQLTYSFDTKKLLSAARELRIAPQLSDIEIDSAYAGKEERRYPIDFGGLFNLSAQVKISLPATIKAKYLPKDEEVTTPWFDFKAVYVEEGNVFKLRHEFKIKKIEVPVADYKEFKKALEEVFFMLRKKIIFEITGAGLLGA